jgi:hypothetical protein
VVDTTLAAVSVPFALPQRIEGKLSGGAPEIKKNVPNSFVVHEYAALALSFMMSFKVIFRQPDRIYAMINNRFAHVTDFETLPVKPAREVYIFGSSGSPRPEPFVKGPDPVEC